MHGFDFIFVISVLFAYGHGILEDWNVVDVRDFSSSFLFHRRDG